MSDGLIPYRVDQLEKELARLTKDSKTSTPAIRHVTRPVWHWNASSWSGASPFWARRS